MLLFDVPKAPHIFPVSVQAWLGSGIPWADRPFEATIESHVATLDMQSLFLCKRSFSIFLYYTYIVHVCTHTHTITYIYSWFPKWIITTVSCSNCQTTSLFRWMRRGIHRLHLHDGRYVGGWAVAAVAAVARQRMEAGRQRRVFSWGFDQPRWTV